MKSWLQDSDIEEYSIHYEEKFVVAERFTRTLKNKIYKYIISILKNMYTDKSDGIVYAYNNKYHSTIKMKPNNVKSNTYMDFAIENNNKDPKFEVDDYVRISK